MSFTTCLKSKTNSLVMELNTSFFSKWWIPSILHYRDLKTPWSLRNTLLLRVNGTEQWFLSFTHFQRLFVKKQHSFGFQWTTNYSIITPPSFSANNVQAVKKMQYCNTNLLLLSYFHLLCYIQAVLGFSPYAIRPSFTDLVLYFRVAANLTL